MQWHYLCVLKFFRFEPVHINARKAQCILICLQFTIVNMLITFVAGANFIKAVFTVVIYNFNIIR
jgi:hypothetical protein